MSIIDELKARVQAVSNGLENGEYMERIIADNEAYICDMNAQEQLYEQGVNALGVSIADYAPYSPVTIQIKQAKGQPTNRVTLRDDGDFERSFFLNIDRQKFTIMASDWKTEELTAKYGKQILGLTPQNKSILAQDYIYPDLLTKIKEEIYG